ncbi:MAG TPA: undecaprenyl/decaprenyl-phosphate alpha-N-acetylglucosaminyl 1-phosphate transferase, partial [Geobacteraceae bacterium]|nr:undecaprenyl/decaprenyl-phosphate alpha-N-acetylglucosaminyl 1-phosphate transferase [Geobacteraceae bacterium]
SPFSADRNHFHHNLLDLGFHNPESVLVIYVIQTVLALSAIYLRYYSDWFLLGGYILFSATVISIFGMARKYGWRLKRFDFLDIVIVGRLKKLRDEGVFIRFLFRTFRAVVPMLLLFTCLIPSQFPVYVAWSAPVIAVMILAVWFLRDDRLGVVIRPALYLLIPFAVYLSETSPAPWFVEPWQTLHNALFVVCALHIFLVSKFSRRKEGFRSTPLDFLVLFIVAVFPNLSIGDIQEYRPGVIAAKIIILYFSYEVLLAELRSSFGRVAGMTLLTLMVVLIAK